MAGHGKLEIQLNNAALSDLAPGVYAVRIRNNEAVIMRERITKNLKE
ncbi:MAG: hypothetical protein JXR41_13685 [Bacteroidales bacterium]|nr:hypothetical protein [Bacteroidales bacterium]MBN2764138.1 hypothetical protein [Bacteroidales bacterium]